MALSLIKLLPEHIANQIAAGEVIQRPASIVKELLENAVDSGATEISLVVRKAGKSLVSVIDNGQGMSAIDIRMSIERHATSKISKAEDLFSISTMGFRGEALASMAAVGQLEIESRREEDEHGSRIVVEKSEIKKQEAVVRARGTKVSLKHLFYNIPARKNFLKSDAVELRHILEEFHRIALSKANIRLSLFVDENRLSEFQPENIKKRICNVFGKKYESRLVPVVEDTNYLKISGFVAKPEFARKTRGQQYFFLNGRFVRFPYLHHAVRNAFDELLSSDQHPSYVLFLELPPSAIDVNVHPSKHEVKLEDERTVYQILQSAIKHALNKFSVSPSIDFEQESAFNPFRTEASAGTGSASSSAIAFLKRTEEKNVEAARRFHQELAKEADKLRRFSDVDSVSGVGPLHNSGMPLGALKDDLAHGFCQVRRSLILVQVGQSFLLVHQQNAHERILYEQFMDAYETKKVGSQQQLFPKSIELNPQDAQLFTTLLPELKAFGFDVQPFGSNSFVVHGLPMDIQANDEEAMFEALLEAVKQGKTEEPLEQRKNIARALAKRNSTKLGVELNSNEMGYLIDQLFACRVASVSPSGHKTFIRYEMEDYLKAFEKKR